VLQTLADTTRKALREGDLFGRFGGDEFAILLPDTHRTQAMEVVERLRTSIQTSPARLADGGALAMTLSIGVADTASNATVPTLEMLMRAADKALYHSKHSGRNQTSFSALDAG
jgi:diguanylate cyclase (GGDEF)-like protein